MPGGWIEVLVDSELPADEVAEFVGVQADRRKGTTLLRGPVRDQAELVGMVARIEALPCRTPAGSCAPWTIRARGRMTGDRAGRFEGFAVSHDGGCTVLVGPLDREAAPAVAGTLLHLQAAGLEVVDVRRQWLHDPDNGDHRP